MNKRIYILYLITLLFCLNTGCEEDQYSEIDNGVYISQAETKTTEKVVVTEDGADYLLSVRLGNLFSDDISASLEIDPDAIEAYNKKNGTNLVALPEEYFTISDEQVTIEKGEINSKPIKIHINKLDDKLPESNKYAIPISINNANGVPIVDAAKTKLLILQRIIITNVAKFENSPANFKMDENLNLSSWTIEFRCKVDAFYKNNQAMFWAYPTEIYSRFGDVVIDKDQFQVKGINAQVNSDTHFTAKQWYHIAMVFDGATFKIYIDGEVDLNVGAEVGKIYEINNFGFGSFKGLLSEVRFFSTVRSQNQIKDNMYALDPNTKGLIGYWRINEGEGDILKDSSPNKRDITLSGITWVHNVKVPELN
ncbi:DUF1735 domain-containing protein [Prolixibacteraceae bacterium]|nr:DUF1735 domain-containing protein [Prolixibacteraceae bacterium]